MNEIVNQAAEYGAERVRKGFEFEVERNIWLAVMDYLPHTAAVSLGVASTSGHIIVFSGVALVAVTGLVIRRRVMSRRLERDYRELHAAEAPRCESWR